MSIDWYRGATHCNWLSEQEGIATEQWCYEIMGNEIKLKANYPSLGGYRLPTEAEMEYATRSGASTSRYYGEMDDLLPKYAWFIKDSDEKTWPVGSLKPNEFGLFDALGNVFTWCQEPSVGYPQGDAISEDAEAALEVLTTAGRQLRGGSFLYRASPVRSASRLSNVPANRKFIYGVRPARTFPIAPPLAP
ncbi:Sulfatase-modifying factor enzyme 1 [Planctomicrobium piriforme]|uniref:Sulfatase-modifying factor enzyme 1 n=2 Tax=Planctomicrobium piriforme TaxID=1576369 RepID=A0A1I3RE61_9PLAN|nr:Sulfatase-modifying factor enzyme 1 [Planctomicrobium piriforme]